MKKNISYLIYVFLIIFTVSCVSKKEDSNLSFLISYYKDLQETETIHSISEKKMIQLENPRLGFQNGVYWFKVTLFESLNEKAIVFDLPESNIDKIKIYQNSEITPYKELEDTHFSLLVNSRTHNNIYFFKAHFDKEVFFPLSVKTYNNAQLNEKYGFFMNGIYYGFALMVLIVNIFFYFSLKDKTFLFYCFFLLSITIVFLDFDGLLNTLLPSSFNKYDILITHYLVPLSGVLFANQFLNIKYYLPKSNRIGMLLLFIATSSFLLYIPTNKFLFIAIGDTISLIVLLHYWGIGVVISKKYRFARFFVLGYSLVLFSALFFVIPLDWGLNTFAASLKTVKFGALFEMLILTYAITYRVQILQKENEQFKEDIQEYLVKINNLKSNEHSTSEKKLENLITTHHLSDREAEVLQLIFKGYTNQKIGEKLFISVNTVKYHIRNIYEKLNIKSKNEAIDILSKIKNPK